MSLLVPLLIPPLANITAGLAVGIANASQADKSSFSLTIGNRVFSNAEPFRFQYLPFELREQIILYALEASKTLLPRPLPAGHPFNDPNGPFYQHPINPNHALYVDPATGESNRNGYPTSAWRWLLISREWWAVARPRLWERTRLRGRWAYKGFLRLAESTDSRAVASFVRELRLEEGLADLGELYGAIRACTKMDSLIYAPEPKSNYAFPFGMQLIPDSPGPKSIRISLPVDLITNSSTLSHLSRLPRLESLDLFFSHFTLDHAQFLSSLPHLKSLILRMPRLEPGPNLLQPFGTQLIPQTLERQEEQQHQQLTKLELNVLTNLSGDSLDVLRTNIRHDDRLQAVCTVYMGMGDDKEVIYAPTVEAVLALVEQENAGTRQDQQDGEGAVSEKHWERTTNLRLFGGLIGLRMEAKK